MPITPKASFGALETRIAKETTYGVAPAAIDQRLGDVSIVPSPDIEVDFYGPTGTTSPTVGTVLTDRAMGDVTGRQSFTGMGYILSSMFGDPVTTTPDATGAPDVRQHVWTYTGLRTAAFNSYSVDFGSTVWASRVLGGLFNGLDLTIARGSLDFSSSFWGKSFNTGIGAGSTPPFAATPTDVPFKPMRGLDYEVWYDNTWAALGTSKAVELYSADVSIGERTAPAEPVNRTRTSDGIVEVGEQEHTFNVLLGLDANADAQIEKLKAGGLTFFRAKATGDIVGGAIPYSFQVDAAVIHSGASAPTDENEVAVMPIDGRIVRDVVSGFAAQFTLVNTVTAY